MNSSTVRGGQPPSVDPEDSEPGVDAWDIPCFRCGVCCSVYQVRIGQGEANLIADSMGMDYWDWVGRYCDPRWSDPRSHLIRHDDRGCVFLKHTAEEGALCSVYNVRPASCREWAADVLKPACQEGLRRFWSVSVDSDGRLQGDTDGLLRLQDFLRRL